MKKLIAFAIFALACASFAQDSSVRIDGSSTVYPISLAIAEEFQIINPDAQVTVAFSGTGGGFEKYCNGETDVNDASRTVREEELSSCNQEVIELPVAFDALTVAVNNEADFVDCLTTDELASIFEPNSSVTTWSDVRDGFPEEAISFFIPGTDSGTFDYFTEAINGETGASRTDVTPSEDDNVLLRGISGSQFALGYFGYAYYVENQSAVKALAIDSGDGCVEPSAETVEDGTYTPLARPLFIYVSPTSAENKPVIGEFIDFYLGEDARFLIEDTGYVLLSEEAYSAAQERFDNRVTGSAFMDFQPGDDIVTTIQEGMGGSSTDGDTGGGSED